MAKRLRRIFGVGVLAGVGYALWRAIEANRSGRDDGWESQPFPFPPQPRQPRPDKSEPPTSDSRASGTGVVDAVDGTCPASHPVKAKQSSDIYHVPGGSSYDRTKADHCYLDAASAEAAGLRPAKH
jgi:hypothetical protein